MKHNKCKTTILITEYNKMYKVYINDIHRQFNTHDMFGNTVAKRATFHIIHTHKDSYLTQSMNNSLNLFIHSIKENECVTKNHICIRRSEQHIV